MRQALAIGVVFVLAAGAAHADSITVTANAGGADISSTTSAVSATNTIRDGSSHAAIAPDGKGAVRAGGAFGGSPNYLEATARYERVIMNTSGVAQDYFFGFTITPAILRILDYAGLDEFGSQQHRASYEIDILYDGSTLFRSTATMRGGSAGHVLDESGTDLGGVFSILQGSAATNRDWVEAQYRFSSYSDTLALGSIAAGASGTLSYRMKVMLSIPVGESGGFATIGDPFDLSSGGAFGGDLTSTPSGGTNPAPVPEPGTWLLFLVGVGLLWRLRTARQSDFLNAR